MITTRAPKVEELEPKLPKKTIKYNGRACAMCVFPP
jgi:hypothetical protein